MWQDFPFACAFYAEDEPLRAEIEAEARRERGPADLAPVPRAVVRQQREPGRLHRLAGVAGAVGGPPLGPRVLPRALAVHPGRARPDPAVRTRQPVQPRRPAPERRRPRHPARVGRLELRGLHPLPRPDPTLLRRVRLPGTADLVDPDPLDPRHADRRPPRRTSSHTRRPPTVPRTSIAAWRRTSPSPTTSRIGTGRRSSTRPAPWPWAWSTSDPGGREPPGRWCGSSTTAGRPRPGRRSTSTGERSRSTTRWQHAFAPRLLTLQPRDGDTVLMAVNDHGDAWEAELVATRQTFTGETLAIGAAAAAGRAPFRRHGAAARGAADARRPRSGGAGDHHPGRAGLAPVRRGPGRGPRRRIRSARP